ncbi:hypothetical protein ACLI4Z_16870 (plasmid) [Natrialbaceae archaeon A-arb3/5]
MESRPTRRRALAALGTASLGLTAGCLDSVLSLDGSRVEVEPEAPGQNSEETPGQFYYLLEEDGITVDELYHDTDTGDLILFYETEAETHEESDDEIRLVYEVFRDGMIDRGAEVNHLYTDVVGGFEGQVEGWGANSQWADQELSGNAHISDVLEKIETTKQYPDGVEPPEDGFGTDDTVTIGDEDGTQEPIEIEPNGNESSTQLEIDSDGTESSNQTPTDASGNQSANRTEAGSNE